MEKELEKLLGHIGSAFAQVATPSNCDNLVTQDDFEFVYLSDGFANLRRHLYDYDPAEVHYLTPFIMRAYLNHFGEDAIMDSNFGLYLFFFGNFGHEIDFIKNRYLLFYSMFDSSQRECICAFLKFLRKFKMDDDSLDDNVIHYWSSNKSSV